MTVWLKLAVALALGAPLAAQAADDEPPLRLNEIQVLGSHNSYRIAPPPAILAEMARKRPDAAQVFAYDHPPLERQLDLGVRQIELDVFADPAGGRFADPPREALAPGGVDRAALGAPGFKVMHIPGIDYRAHCPTLRDCLARVRRWSEAHPRHLPIFITIDAKDRPFGYPGGIDPVPLTRSLLDDLDAELRRGLGLDRVITPDEVRGRHASLREAVRAGGWPTVDAARGRVLVIFDVTRPLAELYRTGHPSLAGRAMFSLYDEEAPEASVVMALEPRGHEGQIRAWVGQGYLVRTRSDADTVEARRRDLGRLQAAEASGAQIVSTDYYPGAPDPEGLSFQVTLPGGVLQRCNPVLRPTGCVLEPE